MSHSALTARACAFLLVIGWTAGVTAAPSAAGEPVTVHRSQVSDSAVPAISAHTVFRAPVETVFRVISDYGNFSDFIPMVAESRIVDRDSLVTRVYQRLDLPFPVADRHYVIDTVDDLHAKSQGVIDVAWSLDTLETQTLPAAHAVTPAAFSGSWHLVAAGADCDAVYTIHVDPGGALPEWLLVRVTEGYVRQVIGAVRKRLASTQDHFPRTQYPSP